MKSSDGSKISFKKEDVSCVNKNEKDIEGKWWVCTANGVQTDLTNRQYPFSEEKTCWWDVFPNPLQNEDSFACSAAKEFGILKLPNN